MARSAILLFLFITTSQISISAEPPARQKVYSLVKQQQTTDWYAEQAELWKEYLSAHASDADAWLNYYTATRMLKIYQKGVTQDDLNDLVDRMGKAIPNTFEFHYVTYWNAGSGSEPSMFEHLKKAYELEPNRPELHDDFMTYYELKRDKKNLEIIAKKWFASNDISPSIYAWNYNMLQSTEPDAILFTVGDNDTYPSMVLQHAQGIRTDVAVINVSLITIEGYRNLWFKELNLPMMTKTDKDFGNWPDFEKAIIEHIKLNSTRPIYFAISAQPQLYEDFKSEVYNVGMALKWSPEKFDNIAVIKKNFEKNLLTDYLKVEFQNDISQGVADHMNANYLIPLITLYNHYEESEDSKAVEMQQLIERIAEKNNMKDQVAEVITKKKKVTPAADPNALTKNFVQINDTMYASKYEVSNHEYMHYLATLLHQKDFSTLNLVKNPEVDWNALLPAKLQGKSDDVVFRNGHPDSPEMPAVNVTYDAANAYCQWLTESYNTSTHKKKTHQKVEFRLPTEKEWEYIAHGGQTKSPYPWGGPYVRNAKGCFLANLDVSEVDSKPVDEEECKGCDSNNPFDLDGAIFPVAVNSYMANDYGLYNVTGNVAEMVSERGIAKGGSWNTKAGVATIDQRESIVDPSPELGFRVIMIVKD